MVNAHDGKYLERYQTVVAHSANTPPHTLLNVRNQLESMTDRVANKSPLNPHSIPRLIDSMTALKACYDLSAEIESIDSEDQVSGGRSRVQVIQARDISESI
jgi:hypothetical protein